MERKTRRAGVLLGTAAVVACLAAGITALVTGSGERARLRSERDQARASAAILQKQARDAENRTRRARSQAAELIGFFTSGLREEMFAIGRADLLEASARRAEAYFEALPPDEIDADSDQTHARMLILRGWSHHMRGALKESQGAFAKAIELLESHIPDPAKADPEHVDTLAHALNESTLPLLQDEQLDASEAANQRALELYQILAEREPDAPAWKHGAAASYFGLADAAMRRRDYPAAEDHFSDAFQNVSSARQQLPDDENYLSLEMISLGTRGQARLRQGKDEAAEKDTEAAAALAERLIELQPTRRKWRREHATLLNNFGSMLDDRGDHQQAIEFLERARGIRKELNAFDPNNASWRFELANSERNRAINAINSGDLVVGWEATESCLSHLEILLRQKPNHADWHLGLKGTVKAISQAFRESDDAESSARIYERIARLFSELAEKDPESRETQWDRQAQVLKIAAERRRDVGNHESSLSHRQKVLQIRQRLEALQPDEIERRYQRAVAHSNLALGHQRLGQWQAALSQYQTAYASYLEVPEGHSKRDTYLGIEQRAIREMMIKTGQLAQPPAVIGMDSEWTYWDQMHAPIDRWMDASIDASTWKTGSGEFGYGDDDEKTLLGSEGSRPLAVYFRRSFTLDDPASVTSIHFLLLRDDGAVIYLNGQEVARDLMPEGPIAHDTRATEFIPTNVENEPIWIDASIDPSMLKAGENVLAVSIHQVDPESSDISFDLAMFFNAPAIDPLEGFEAEEVETDLP